MDRGSWDERYRSRDLVWGIEPNRFLAEQAESLPPSRALDLACGEGRNALWLAEQGWRVTAVDFSKVAVDRGRSLATEWDLDVEWVEGDVTEWDPPAEDFDLVIVFYLHLPADQRHRVMDRARRALAPGGTILVVGHDSTNLTAGYGGPQDPALLYEPDDLVADLDGLTIERAERVTRRVATDHGERTAIDALVRARRA